MTVNELIPRVTVLFNTLIPLSHELWLLFTHDCTRAVTTRYTTLDAMIEIRSTSVTVE